MAGATRTVAKNTVLLTAGVLFGRALSALLIRFMTPELGTGGIGIWGTATDLTAILLVTTNWGLGTLLTREITRSRGMTGALLWATLRIRWVLGAVCYGLMWAFVRASGYPALDTAAVLVTGLAIFIESTAMACDAVLQAHEKVEHQSSSQIVSAVVYFGLGWLWLHQGHGLMGVVWANVVSRVARLAVIAPLMLRSCGPWRRDPDAPPAPGMLWMLRLGLPMFMATTFGIIYNKVDTVMLKNILGNDPAGLYVLGHRALDIMILIPSLFGFAVFPAMARYGMESPAAAVRLGERALRFMLVAVVPLTLFLTFTAGPIIGFFDQDGQFPDSVKVLMIVIWALPVQAANTIFGRLLITANRERAFVSIGLVAMLTNVVLNSLWIPRHSYFGASWATFISVGMSMAMHLGWLQRTDYRLPLLRALAGPAGATALAWGATAGLLKLAAPGWGVRWTGLPLQAWGPFLGTTALMTVIYVTILALLRVLRRGDLDLLRELVPSRSPTPPE